MDYRKITCKSSSQYKLIHSKEITICSNGLLRDTDGNVGIAIGKAYATVGDVLIISLENGNVINAIVVDNKATKDTNNDANQKIDGSMIEFVVDTKKLPENVKTTGDMSSLKEYKGNIVKIERVIV